MNEKILQQILSEVTGIKGELADVKTDMADMKTELSSVKTDVASMKTELSVLKTDVGTLQTDLTSVKAQLDENTKLTRAILDRQEETDARLESVAMDVHKMQGDITSLKEDVSEIKSGLEFTFQKTAKNEMDIFKIRRDLI